MQLGMIGLGRMGGNIVRRLARSGHRCVVFDRNPAAIDAARGRGSERRRRSQEPRWQARKAARRLGDAARRRRSPSSTVAQLGELLDAGDIIIDGGNSFYKDDIRRARTLQDQGHSLRRLRHQRRRLGPRARLLPDDRRRQGGGRSPRSDLRRPGAGPWRHSGHAGPQRPRSPRGTRLRALRPERRRTLRQDDPQRHRIRPHAGLCGRVRHPARRRLGRLAGGSALRSSTCPTSPRSGAAAASSGPGCST